MWKVLVEIKEVASLTDVGLKRTVNEDAVLSLSDVPIFAVTDGMGGEGAGDVASGMAMGALEVAQDSLAVGAEKVLADRSPENRIELNQVLERLLQQIDGDIAAKAEETKTRNMATTMVAAMIVDDHAYIAHVGDSRAYLLRDGRLRLLTDDHTLAMLRFRRGRMTADEFKHSPLRHRLYQALGSGGDIDVDLAEIKLADDDIFLLCSDGIHAQLEPRQILGSIRQGNLETGAARLIDAANQAGGNDNASVLLFRVGTDAQADSVDAISDVLREVFLFKTLSDAQRNVLAPYLDQRQLKAGEVLFLEGDPGDAFYVVLDGEVSITKGGTHLVDVGAGGHFGELCLSRPVPRSATVTAKTDALIFGLSRDRFSEIIRRRPAMGALLCVAVLDTVGDRLRDLTQRLNTTERVAKGEIRPEGLKPRDAVLAALAGKV